jgi:hypothetical protein
MGCRSSEARLGHQSIKAGWRGTSASWLIFARRRGRRVFGLLGHQTLALAPERYAVVSVSHGTYTHASSPHTRPMIGGRRVSRARRRRFGGGESPPLNVGTLVVCELICVLTWALTGTGYALIAALVAGLGLVLAAVTPESPPTRRRRVR